MRRTSLIVGLSGVVAVASVACESVPDITFYPDSDASGDGGSSGDGATTDAAPICPSAAPLPTECCGPIACSGDCAPNCDRCLAQCHVTDVCCVKAKGDGVACRPLGSTTCP